MIKEFDGIMPEIDESVFVAESADIIGDVKIGKNSSIWYNTVLRGDEHAIRIGENTNIQDGTVIHVGWDVDTVIGDNVTVGHNALVHGCKIGNNSLVGMGAIVLNGAEIGEYCMIAAGALVTQNKKFPDGVLIMGSPAKVVRELTDEEKQSLIKSADDYYKLISTAARTEFLPSGKQAIPLTARGLRALRKAEPPPGERKA